MRGVRAGSALLAATALAFVAAAPAIADELLRTDPSHNRPVPRLGGMGTDRDSSPPKHAFPSQIVIRDRKKEWRKSGAIDKELSQACAEGYFDEIVPKYYRAIFKDAVLGVAFGYGLNLRDDKRLADPKMIYLFSTGDATACTVLSVPNKDPRVEKFKSPPRNKTPNKPNQPQTPAAK